MEALNTILRNEEAGREVRFFRLDNEKDQKELHGLIDQGKVITLSDTFESQLRELFVFRQPGLYQDKAEQQKAFSAYLAEQTTTQSLLELGVWAYFSWSGALVHLLEDDDFQLLRTARNRNLISAEEQTAFYGATVAVAGLSVGSSAVMSIVQTGGAGHLKLADNDTLDLSNLNRIRTTVASLGAQKTTMIARQVLEQNPYAKIELFDDGVTEENMSDFLEGIDVLVEEMDNLEMKVRIRQEARKRGIPVVMATDNGDHGLIDVERYDKDPILPIYHDRIPNIEETVLGKELSLMERGRLITQHVGPENVALRMQQSLLQIGRTLVTYPQLGTAAALNGVAVAYVVRRIVNGLPVIDDRAAINLDAMLDADYYTQTATKEREEHLAKFRTALKL